jgi:hypothetical protein
VNIFLCIENLILVKKGEILMVVANLEDKVASLENSLKAYQNLAKEVQILKDKEEIATVQYCYGYYFEKGMIDEILDLFADGPDVEMSWGGKMTWKGKDVLKKTWAQLQKPMEGDPEFMHLVMMLDPIITVASDGQTAKGRFYAYGMPAVPHDGGVHPSVFAGIYENNFIKQNGKWRIQRMELGILCKIVDPKDTYVKRERIEAAGKMEYKGQKISGGEANELNTEYPSGYIIPFHFKHPVTGKETSENARNAKNPHIYKKAGMP